MLNDMPEKLENYLETYDMILLVETENDNTCKGLSGEDLAGKLLNSQAFLRSEKKILILSEENYPEKEYKELIRLYYMYEFSDKVRIIGRTNQHGNLMNYVDNGLVTEEEISDLILQ